MSAAPAQQVRFGHSDLQAWVAAMFGGRGLPDQDALIAAEGLLDADLRAVPTHGVAQLPTYLGLLDKGVTNPRPDIRFSGKSGLMRLEADRGLGQVVTMRAMERLEPVAREAGMAGAAIAQAGHLGGLGYFADHAARKGLIAIVFQNGPPLMGLEGSQARAIGNNPLAFGAPVTDGPPLVFDAATSEAAYGKIINAKASGADSIPAGWALDAQGIPTTDPAAAVSGILLPMAGSKGIGIAMLVEVLAGSLSGTVPVAGENIFGGFVMLIDPLAVQDADGFDAHMRQWVGAYHRSAPNARYPGERAAETRARQLETGVQIDRKLAQALAELGEHAGILLPSPL